MKLPQSNSIMKAPRSLFVAGAFGLLGLSNSAQAVVTVTFAQAGSNVTATLSGSLQVPLIGFLFDDNAPVGADDNFGATNALLANVVGTPSYDEYFGGQPFASGLSQSPDSFSGPSSFGYANQFLRVDASALPGGVVSPTGTWTWNNTTLAGIGLGSLTSTPQTVYSTAGSGDTIQFALVPEPSSSVLLGLGVTALLFRRRRLA